MAKLVGCRECGIEVSKSAKTCPHCGVSHPGTSKLEMFGGAVIFIGLVIGGVAWMNPGPTVKAAATSTAPQQQEAPKLDEKRPIFVGQKGAILCPARMLLAAMTGNQHDRGVLGLGLGLNGTARPDAEAIADGCQRIEPGTQLYDAWMHDFGAFAGMADVNIVAGQRILFGPDKRASGVPLWVTWSSYLTNSP